jgi:hypothetical protein
MICEKNKLNFDSMISIKYGKRLPKLDGCKST